MNEISIILPAYNEEENLERLTERWQDYREILENNYELGLSIFLVDDGSIDGTKEIGEELEKKYDNFKIISHEENKGLGVALKTGISYIIENRPYTSYICIMDCDNTQDPKYIVDMIEKEKKTGADVVIASRYETGARVKGVSSFRLLTSFGARFIYGIFLKVDGVKDYTCGYRLYRRHILERLLRVFGEKSIQERGFTCMVELLYKLYICGSTFAEVPFELRYDFKGGNSKMKVIKTSINSIKLTLRLKKLNKKLGTALEE